MTHPRIPEVELSSVSQLAVLVEKFGDSADYLYRGQSAKWGGLTTSVERLKVNAQDFRNILDYDRSAASLGINEDPFRYLRSFEANHLLRDYQRRVRHFLTDLPDPEDFVSWFALMQHHGVPTRLLDVTKSIFVALYFATSDVSEHDGMIYSMFSPGLLLLHIAGSLSDDITSFIKDSEEASQDDDRLFAIANRVIKSDNLSLSRDALGSSLAGIGSGLLEVANLRPTKREIAQQGKFIMPFTLSKSLEDNMHDFYKMVSPKVNWTLPSTDITELGIGDYHSCPIIKFRIPRDKFRGIRIALKHMNITAESLYPDFEGLNTSMKEKVESYKEIYPLG